MRTLVNEGRMVVIKLAELASMPLGIRLLGEEVVPTEAPPIPGDPS